MTISRTGKSSSSEDPLNPQEAFFQRLQKVVKTVFDRYTKKLAALPLVVAVSGGPDSLALLALLASSDSLRDRLIVAHFSHGLRPRAEVREIRLVESIASRWGIQTLNGKADVASFAKENHQSIEEAARQLRYEFLSDMAKRYRAGAIVLGHTLDDQAETILFRLTRGSGLRGLGAMREWTTWIDPVSDEPTNLLRPLLEIPKCDTQRVCEIAQIIPAQDSSNLSGRFARNRIRLHVLPQLERINPQIRRTLARFASAVRADEDLITSEAREAVLGLEEIHQGVFEWPRATLVDMPTPLLARLFQSAWQTLCGPGAALSQTHLKAMIKLLIGPSGRRLDLPGTLTFAVEYHRCTLGKLDSNVMLPPKETDLPVPGVVQFGPWTINARVVGPTPNLENNHSPCNALMDAKAIGDRLTIRLRRPGDRFHPLGLQKEKSLQDFLIDRKIPKRERDAIPLLVGKGHIAWIVGYRVAAWAMPSSKSSRLVAIEFQMSSTSEMRG